MASTTKLAVLVLVLLAQHAAAATFDVASVSELTAALAAVADGDTIRLSSAATFAPQETIVVNSLAQLRIVASGPGPALFDCSAAGPICMLVRSCSGVSLAGLRMVGATSTALRVSGSSAVSMTDLAVADCNGVQRSAVEIDTCQLVTVDRIDIRNVVNSESSGAMSVMATTGFTLRSASIVDNSSPVHSALSVWSSSGVLVEFSTLRGNGGKSPVEFGQASARIADTQLVGNTEIALLAASYSTVVLQRCNVQGNSGSAPGASLLKFTDSNATLQCCNVSGNSLPPATPLILFAGTTTTFPNGFTCVDGQLYQNSQPTGLECVIEPMPTLLLSHSVLFTQSQGAAVSLYEATLIADGVQLSAPLCLAASGKSSVLTTSASRLRGNIQCSGQAVTTQWAAGVCGSAPCACGALALATPSLTVPFSPCRANSTAVLPTPEGPVVVEGPPGVGVQPVLNASAPGVVSPVVSVTVNGTGGNVGPVTITLPVNCSLTGYCLAYFDDDTDSWLCVDECLTLDQDGQRCYATGVTPHLTNFALLLTGNDGCSDGGFYKWATITALALAAAVILLVVVVFGYVPRLSDWCLGEEGARVKKLRSHVKDLGALDDDNNFDARPTAADFESLSDREELQR